jgi:hypothetical protein
MGRERSVNLPLNVPKDPQFIKLVSRTSSFSYITTAKTATEIYFDETHISKNGKHIQLDKATGELHKCDE